MTKFLTTASAAMLCGAATFASDMPGLTAYFHGYTWTFTLLEGNTAAITSCTPEPEGNIVIPSGVDLEVWKEGALITHVPVSSIESECFKDCTKITSVEFPDKTSFRHIRSRAFEGCSNITSIVMHPGLASIGARAFAGCRSLTSVHFPQGVEQISRGAFEGCMGLTEIMVPKSVNEIGSGAFRGCDNIVSMELPFIGPCRLLGTLDAYSWYWFEDSWHKIYNGLKYFNSIQHLGHVFGSSDASMSIHVWSFFNGAYSQEYVYVPKSLRSVVVTDSEVIQGGAFGGCSNLTSVVFQCPAFDIGPDACADCSNLLDVKMPNTVTNIRASVFKNCGKLTNVIFPERLVNIGDSAFWGCSNLCEELVLPESIKTIGADAFGECVSIKKLVISPWLKEIPAGAFRRCLSLFDLTISEGVEKIGMAAFESCNTLEQVTVPSSVKSMDGFEGSRVVHLTSGFYSSGGPFIGCNRLREVIMLDGCENIGGFSFYDCPNIASITIPNSVTNIGRNAFSGCALLTNVEIPDSVMSVSRSAFNGCNRLVNVTIPQCVCADHLSAVFASSYQSITNVVISDGVTSIGVSLFEGCIGLTNVVLPDSVVSIGESAFEGCSGLVSIMIGSGVTSIGASAFGGCIRLRNIMIPEGVTSVEPYLFSGCIGLTSVTIPSGVMSIGTYAFRGCVGLTTMTIPDGVTVIESGAFDSCSGLKSVWIPDSVINIIGVSPFSKCGSLTSITVDAGNPNYSSTGGLLMTKDGKRLIRGINGDIIIPDGVISIQQNAFYGCSGLTSVVIPDSVTSIGAYAFYGCSGLTSVAIPDSVTSIGGQAFSYCGGLESVTIPDSVTSVEADAFKGCSNVTSMVASFVPAGIEGSVTSVTFPDGVTSIRNGAFSDCTNLTSVTIPDGITSIGSSAFYGCSGLTSVVIPNSVTSIGSSAFYRCTFLTNIIFKGDAPTLGSQCFGGYSGSSERTVHVDRNSTGWGVEIPGTWNGMRIAYIDEMAKPETYIVTFDLGARGTRIGGGELVQTVENGCAAVVPEVAVPNGWELLGWDGDFSCVTSDMTITAQYSQLPVWSGSETVDGITWLFVVSNGVAEITSGEPLVSAILVSTSGDVVVPSMLGGCPVVSVGDYAFCDCKLLSNIVIAASVTRIGDYAFAACRKLTNVMLPDGMVGIGDEAFFNCTSLTNMMIPSSVTNINVSAFEGCAVLSNFVVGIDNPRYSSANGMLISKDGTMLIHGINGDVVIPDGVTSIGDHAFRGCSGLTSVAIPDSVTNVGRDAFSYTPLLESITLPDGMISIGNMAFYYSGIQTITFNGDAPGIGDDCFINTDDAIIVYVRRSSTGWGVEIPGTWNGMRIEYLEEDAPDEGPVEFTIVDGVLTHVELNGATEVVIPDSVTSIVREAFLGCSGLTSVTIPDSVISIGRDAFSNCDESLYDTSSIPGVILVDGWVIGYDDDETYGRKIDLAGARGIGDYALSFCPMAGVTIPDSVVGIGAGAFLWSGLSSVDIPSSVVRIGDGAFAGCFALTSIEVAADNEWYKSIDGLLLSKDEKMLVAVPSGLVSVTIPEAVANIGDIAFDWCDSLTNIIFNGNAPAAGSAAFNSVPDDCVVQVHRSSTGWGVEIPGTWNGLRIEYLEEDAPDENQVEFTIVDGTLTHVELNGATEVVIPDSVTRIGEDAFYECSGLTSVMIPDSVTSIGYGAFSECSGLTSVAIPDSVTNIEEEAFCWCGISSVSIGNSVTSIGESAFSGCMALERVSIPTSVMRIGDRAFFMCYALASVTGLRDDMDVAVTAFNGTPFDETRPFKLGVRDGVLVGIQGTCPAVLVIPDGVTAIDEAAFDKWSHEISDYRYYFSSSHSTVDALETVFIPASVERIGFYAFCGCANLSCVEIANPDVMIDGGAFFECTGLVSLGIQKHGATLAGWKGVCYEAWDICEYVYERGELVVVTNFAVGAEVHMGPTIAFMTEGITVGGSMGEINDNYGLFWFTAIWEIMADLIPEVAVDAGTAVVDATVDGVGFADEGVKAAIGGSAAEYAAFKEWAGSVKGAGSAGASAAGEAAVVANKNAAAAYLLGAERLFENAPVVEIGEVVVWERTSGTGGSGETGEAGGTAGTGGSEGTETSISVTVTVKDGEEAVKCAAEKVKAMFEATGDLGDWSGRRVGDNAPCQNALPVSVTVEEGEGAMMRFKVTPGDGTAPKAFLRIRK